MEDGRAIAAGVGSEIGDRTVKKDTANQTVEPTPLRGAAHLIVRQRACRESCGWPRCSGSHRDHGAVTVCLRRATLGARRHVGDRAEPHFMHEDGAAADRARADDGLAGIGDLRVHVFERLIAEPSGQSTTRAGLRENADAPSRVAHPRCSATRLACGRVAVSSAPRFRSARPYPPA